MVVFMYLYAVIYYSAHASTVERSRGSPSSGDVAMNYNDKGAVIDGEGGGGSSGGLGDDKTQVNPVGLISKPVSKYVISNHILICTHPT
jgi:hypothetical protein